jgi:arylsulfatase A-like enzyme
LTDLFATCAAVIGVDLPDSQAEDSFSWLPLIESANAASSGKTVISERGAPVIHHSGSGMFAIRDGKWKLVCGNGSGGRQQPRGKPFERPYQLFDLESDLAESTNVAEAFPEVVEQLTSKLEELRKSGRSRPSLEN